MDIQILEMDIEIMHVTSGEIRFPQRQAVINYGSATVTTYNLVNCIAIGGRFKDKKGEPGIFFTHESPTDKDNQKKKLSQIKHILEDAVISDIFIFRLADGSNGEIIAEMFTFIRSVFRIEPQILNYGCDTRIFYGIPKCGKASISTDTISVDMVPIQVEADDRDRGSGGAGSGGTSKPLYSSDDVDTFEPLYLKDKDGDIIIECPICKSKSGRLLEAIFHFYGCPNTGKRPDLSKKPAKGGRRKKTPKQRQKIRRTKKRLNRHRSK